MRMQNMDNGFPKKKCHECFLWRIPSRYDRTGWISSYYVLWPAIATMMVITTINVTWTSSSAGWACSGMLRCDFWMKPMKPVQVPITAHRWLFLRSEKYSATLHDAHLKVARLDQESECAQWISLAKHIVVKLTTSRAMTKRPSSIWFHRSWQSRSQKSQQGLATTLFFMFFQKHWRRLLFKWMFLHSPPKQSSNTARARQLSKRRLYLCPFLSQLCCTLPTHCWLK